MLKNTTENPQLIATLEREIMRKLSARGKLAEEQLSAGIIHSEMSKIFPKKNDYGNASFEELVPELNRFGILTRGKFKALMKKHRRKLLQIDRDRLSYKEIQYFSESFGAAFVKGAVRGQYWFAYPALVRTAAELEFGEVAVVYE